MDLLLSSDASASAMWCWMGGMWPWCCAGWISTGCPLVMAGDEDAEAEVSLCPAEALDMDGCRESGGPWLETD